jgi:hypothetical protein
VYYYNLRAWHYHPEDAREYLLSHLEQFTDDEFERMILSVMPEVYQKRRAAWGDRQSQPIKWGIIIASVMEELCRRYGFQPVSNPPIQASYSLFAARAIVGDDGIDLDEDKRERMRRAVEESDHPR